MFGTVLGALRVEGNTSIFKSVTSGIMRRSIDRIKSELTWTNPAVIGEKIRSVINIHSFLQYELDAQMSNTKMTQQIKNTGSSSKDFDITI